MQNNEEFPFPFSPYTIQTKFMKELYNCLENSKLGIFESPTGTGKSMSIICGALKWLCDYEELQKNQLNSEISELDEEIRKHTNFTDNWFYVQTQQIELNNKKQILQSKLHRIEQYEQKKNALKKVIENVHEKNRVHSRTTLQVKNYKVDVKNITNEENKEEILKEDLCLEELQDSESSEDENEEEESFESTKIFFCSRTHSQLSQFIRELKKSPYSKNISVITLASRQSYCINKNVNKLKHLNLINETCMQLQKKKATIKVEKDIKRTKVASSCPFMPGNQDLLVGHTLAQIHDIEDIVQKGKSLKTCVYYASRKAVVHNQLILVPYNTILHENTRTSSGINLKGNIVIIDEAHNLLEAIERMHSVLITGRNLLHCYNQLSQYQKRYQSSFSAKNHLSLSQLSFCLKKLLTVLGATAKSNVDDVVKTEAPAKLYKVEEFELMSEIDTINIFELLRFIKKSRLNHKLRGFVEQYSNSLNVHEYDAKPCGVKQFLNTIKTKATEPHIIDEINAIPVEEGSSNPIMVIINFLECLKNCCSDGRILVIPGVTVGQSTIKFLLLNPAAHFHTIVQDARSVILAGGTMEPMNEYIEQLFIPAGATHERIVTFSCDHVVSPENILCSITTHGPTGIEFEFNYQNQEDIKLLDELGRTLLNLCNIIPAGIVVFFPSYKFVKLAYTHLEKSGIIAKLSLKKLILQEPKLASQVNQILEQFAVGVKKPERPKNGSLMFSVVGGKLSEGLNFADDLGRCVIVVGMPYPNIKSVELQEKIKYLNENIKSTAGKDFYENSCMKAVNQCIGRAIRHINDYSTVILLDKRYTHKTKVLPHWIQRTLMINDTFGSTMSAVSKFFNGKKNKFNKKSNT